MKFFLEMIEQVKRQSEINILDSFGKLGEQKTFKPEVFFHFVEHCQPFVFYHKEYSTEKLDLLMLGDKNNYVPILIASPFKIWSAEMAGNNFISIKKPGTAPVSDVVGLSIICFMAVEQSPKQLLYFMYSEITLDTLEKIKQVTATNSLDGIAKELVDRMYEEKTGVEPGIIKVNVGSGKTKKRFKINRVIHVRPKKVLNTRSDSGVEIDWSHRWKVRAHWRFIGQGKIGKDREGNYTQTDFTWIEEYIKGPESKPLIDKKLRIVD